MPRSTATGRIAATGRLAIRDFGTALSFNGVSDLVTIPHNANQLLTTGFTLSAWINPRSLGDINGGRIFDKTGGAGTGGFYFKVGSSNVVGFAVNAGTDRTSATNSVPLGQWTHALVTVASDATVTFYINGVASGTPVTTSALSNITTTANLIIGDRADTARSFNGFIDEPRIWNVALTQAQITALYQQGTVPTTGLVAEYKFNEGSGTLATDSSGNGNTGTITGATYTSDVPIKTRKAVNGNLVYNGDFEYAPAVNVATTSGDKWIDGTIGGGTTTNEIFGWYFWNYASSYAAMFDTTTKYSGNASMKVSTTGTGSTAGLRVSVHGNTSFRQNNIPVLPNTSYTCSAMIKTQVISGAATTGARLQFVTSTGTNDIATTTVVTGLNTTKDWTLYTTTFTSNATARYVTPVLQIIGNNGAGTLIMDAWFDDIILKPTTPETRTIVT